ncbi:uncharacterized protein Z519_04708 [Cladophialophora bantiana CBS 173.52]|uniref:FAD-binding domain-containing protein n=1 Tax=Cladophialophora bantiana (strain ATCC 10958 / CBS 173.52 / CDC B-1940 / NIH 8579) TaxID=1442370 RepID=A0A0D2EXN1_CLAB1|nr:uncharacterized protein Z519_04708 [Cladophialophora bantiana CBS 173.52]KIW94731.1 hypothetical protein Z519_04708 [Cladophialophora bantiana CBS 173.52]
MEKPLAIVVGAGIAGLAAAWWLDKAGWQSVVVERAATFRAGGYTLSIAGLGYETIQHMNLLDDLKSVAHAYESNIISDNNGKELCRIRYADVYGGLEALAVRRDGVARTLAKVLGSSIRFNETVSSFTDRGDKIRAVLAGGDVIEADLLIGADGFRSKIRQQLFEDAGHSHLEPLGYYYAAYNFETRPENKENCYSFNSPGHLDMLFTAQAQGMTGMHIWREDRCLSTETSRDRFDILREITAKSVSQVREAVERAEKAEAFVNMDSLTLVTLPKWSKGRVVLLGDAAHCLTLLSGQGAGMALTSAEILGKELQKTTDVLQALRNHEAKLRPTIERLQARSRKMARWYIPKSAISYHSRNFLLKLLPYSWIVAFHVDSLRSEIELT